MRLSNDFRDTLSSLVTNYQFTSSSDFTTMQTGFLNRFRGIVLKSSTKSSVLRFQATNTSLFIRLYFHVGQVTSTFDLGFTNAGLQFNKIDDNLSHQNPPPAPADTILAILKKATDQVPSKMTGHDAYIQAGTGFMTKIELPYLKLLLTQEHIRILQAELLLYPEKNTFQKVPLPSKLALYLTNSVNSLGAILNDTTKTQLIIDRSYGDQTYYIIDVSNFVNSFYQNYSADVPSLMVSFGYSDNSSKLNRLILSDGSTKLQSTRLRITYWRY
jgi:hypothetical protein